MFDHKTLAERDGDDELLAAYRAWRALMDKMNDEIGGPREEDCIACDKIERRIYATPVTGVVGLAVLSAMMLQCADPDGLYDPCRRALIEALPRFVPEMAGLATELYPEQGDNV